MYNKPKSILFPCQARKYKTGKNPTQSQSTLVVNSLPHVQYVFDPFKDSCCVPFFKDSNHVFNVSKIR